jgi:hypothetical protein
VPAYVHESGERTVTVPGSPLHREMVAKAADPASGWSLDQPPALVLTDPPNPEEDTP